MLVIGKQVAPHMAMRGCGVDFDKVECLFHAPAYPAQVSVHRSFGCPFMARLSSVARSG